MSFQIPREDLVTRVDDLLLTSQVPPRFTGPIRETARTIKGWRVGGTGGFDLPECRCLLQVALDTNSLRGFDDALFDVAWDLDRFAISHNRGSLNNQVQVIG